MYYVCIVYIYIYLCKQSSNEKRALKTSISLSKVRKFREWKIDNIKY